MADERAVPGIPGARAIRVERLGDRLAGGVAYSPLGEVAEGRILLRAEGIGLFLVRDGTVIEYALEAEADAIVAERFLWGSARSALIHQRGELPLHASALARPDDTAAIALCGPSGAGKSTLAAALSQLGWRILADDQARIAPQENRVMVWPGPAAIKLCADACAALAIETRGFARDGDDRGKVLMPVSPRDHASPLAAVVEIVPDQGPVSLERLEGASALAVLSRHVVGPRKMRALTSGGAHFALVGAVAQAVTIWRLHGRAALPARALAEHLHRALG